MNLITEIRENILYVKTKSKMLFFLKKEHSENLRNVYRDLKA